MIDGKEIVNKWLEQDRLRQEKFKAMSPLERAKRVYNNTCQRCGEHLELDFNYGLCDECHKDIQKRRYDIRHSLN